MAHSSPPQTHLPWSPSGGPTGSSRGRSWRAAMPRDCKAGAQAATGAGGTVCDRLENDAVGASLLEDQTPLGPALPNDRSQVRGQQSQESPLTPGRATGRGRLRRDESISSPKHLGGSGTAEGAADGDAESGTVKRYGSENKTGKGAQGPGLRVGCVPQLPRLGPTASFQSSQHSTATQRQ